MINYYIYLIFLIAPATINLKSTVEEIDQTKGILKLKIKRKDQKRGRIVIPWRLKPDSPDSVYVDVKGTQIFILFYPYSSIFK